MSYAVKEIFYTLQGEGAQTGRAASNPDHDFALGTDST